MRWLGAVEAHSTPRLIASRRTCFVSSEVTLLEDDGGIDKKLDTVVGSVLQLEIWAIQC